jgi:hypothetical protein
MMGVQQIRVVERLALTFIDRPGVAVAEPGKLGGRPGDLPAGYTGRGVRPGRELPRARVDAGDDPRIAVVDVPLLVGVSELHPVADGELRCAMLGFERHVRAGQLALGRAMPRAQLGKQPAALDAGELPVVPGQHHLGPGALGFRHRLPGHPAVQHGRRPPPAPSAGPVPSGRS